MIYLANSFSLQMLNLNMVSTVVTTPLTEEEVKEILSQGFVSAVGHADTANVLTTTLGLNIPMNRVNISLTPGDVLVVAQLTGGRLPEGSMTLPEGFSFKYVKVVLVAEIKPH